MFENIDSLTNKNGTCLLQFVFYIFNIEICIMVLIFFMQIQDVFLMIRRKKTTIFTDAKETTNVSELKKIIQGRNFQCYVWDKLTKYLLDV